MTMLEQLLEQISDDIAERVIKRLSDQNSTWLNNIQYKVKAENVEGLEEAFCKALDAHEPQIRQWGAEAASSVVEDLEIPSQDEIETWAHDQAEETATKVVKNADFEVKVSF